MTLSYEQIFAMGAEELERLATAGLLDDETLERIAHVGRFYACIGKLAGSSAVIGDVFHGRGGASHLA